MTEQISVALLRQLLRYEPETGKLFWLPRDVSMFEDCPAANKTAQHVCAWWNKRFAGKEAFTSVHPDGHRMGTLKKRTVKTHRIIVALVIGEWPDQVDHINGKRGDNRWINLRPCGQQVNMQNKKIYKSNKSGFHGVCFHKRMKRWQANINVNGKRKFVGSFSNKSDAIAARKEAEALHGCFHSNHGRIA